MEQVPANADFMLLRWFAQGVPLATIEDPDGRARSKQIIRGQTAKQNTGGRPRKIRAKDRRQARIEQARQLRNEGLSYRKIADRLNEQVDGHAPVTHNTVKNWLCKFSDIPAGIPNPNAEKSAVCGLQQPPRDGHESITVEAAIRSPEPVLSNQESLTSSIPEWEDTPNPQTEIPELSMPRKKIPDPTQASILVKSRRRCCLCWGLNGLDQDVPGQLAHLDRNNENFAEDNLAYLRMNHHDAYDGTTRLSKGLTEKEVRHWRDQLYAVNAKAVMSIDAMTARKFIRHAKSIIAALGHVKNRHPSLGTEREIIALAECATELGMPIPIEIKTIPYPDDITPDNLFLKDRWEGRCTIRFPDGTYESGIAAHCYGIEMLVEARSSAIVALKQWMIRVDEASSK